VADLCICLSVLTQLLLHWRVVFQLVLLADMRPRRYIILYLYLFLVQKMKNDCC
jgi:hypothetical protein